MRLSLLLILTLFLSEAHGQLTAPYNPESNQDSTIGSADLIDMLSYFGLEFLPPAIEVDGQDILATLNSLTEQVATLQTQVNTMQSELMTKDSVIRLTWLRDLSFIDLAGATLVESDFGRVNLSFANLENAQLMNSSFYNALLSGANLSGANLTNADFEGTIRLNADLTGATFGSAFFGYATLEGADLSGTDLSSSYLENTIMNCLRGCPDALPSGFECIPDVECEESDRFRITENE